MKEERKRGVGGRELGKESFWGETWRKKSNEPMGCGVATDYRQIVGKQELKGGGRTDRGKKRTGVLRTRCRDCV